MDFPQVHYLVVTAKDGAADPRISTATVTVLVSDVGDEPPIFTQQVYEALVPENVPDTLVATVAATDPDTRPAVRKISTWGIWINNYLSNRSVVVKHKILW